MAPEYWYVGFDLAARYSGAVLLSDHSDVPLRAEVFDYGPAAQPSNPSDHIPLIVDSAIEICHWLDDAFIEGIKVVIGVEDVHPHAINAKAALRAQGALLTALYERGWEATLVPVLVWQRWHGFSHKKVEGRTTKTQAKERCDELGLDTSAFKGKSTVDIRDAFLLAYYLRGRSSAVTNTEGAIK